MINKLDNNKIWFWMWWRSFKIKNNRKFKIRKRIHKRKYILGLR